MTGKQEGPYKGEETKAEEDKVWQLYSAYFHLKKINRSYLAFNICCMLQV